MEERIMKKIFVMMCAFAAAFGCQKAEMEQPQESEGVKVPLQVTASIAQTKTTMTNEDGVLKSAWKDGDKIYVQRFWDTCYAQENVIECTAEVSGSNVAFSTEDHVKIPDVAENQYYRYTLLAEYPKALSSHAVSRKFAMSTTQTQTAPGDLSHIAQSDIMYAWASVDWTADPVCADFQFKHALSVLQLDLKGSQEGISINRIDVEMLDETGADWLVVNGQINMRDGVITQKSGDNKLSLILSTPVALPTDEYAQFYMTISPGHAGQTFKVSVVADLGEVIEVGSMTVPAENPIPQGAKAYKSFIVTADKEEVDYASAIDLSAQGTSNTYVVNAPNTLYKFNAQKIGNGVVPTALAEVVTSTDITPKSALSLWYTCKQTSTKWQDEQPVVVNSILLKDGYIYFKTPETFVNGNMVIAAFAEDGISYSNIQVNENREFINATILWSWDIWAVEGYNPDASKIAVGEQYLMDRNLGALVALSDADAAANLTNGVWVANGQGNYYEFGRKDPFPGFAEYPAYLPMNYGQKLLTTPTYTFITALQMHEVGASKNLNKQMFGTSAAACTPSANTKDYTAAELLAYVTGNPHKDINGGSSTTYCWHGNGLNSHWKGLWGDDSANKTPYKTIYDPCPAGWKLWEYGTMENFVIANEAQAKTLTDNKQTCFGIDIAGSLFPMNSGGRNYDMGLNGNNGAKGCLINCQPGAKAPIALYTSAPYYYLNGTYYSGGNYAGVTNWTVSVTADGLDLSMTDVDTAHDDRKYVIPATAYTSRAIPVRCIKE